MNVKCTEQVPYHEGQDRSHILLGLGVPCDKDGWTPMDLLFERLNDSYQCKRLAGLRHNNEVLRNRKLLHFDEDYSGNIRFGHWLHACCSNDPNEKIRFEYSTYVREGFDMNLADEQWLTPQEREFTDPAAGNTFWRDLPDIHYNKHGQPRTFIRAFLNSAVPWTRYNNTTIPV